MTASSPVPVPPGDPSPALEDEVAAPVRRPHWAYREILLLAAVMASAQGLTVTSLLAFADRFGGLGAEDAAALLRREPLLAVPLQVAMWLPGLAYIWYVVTRQYGFPLRTGLGWHPLPRPATSYLRLGVLLALGSVGASFLVSEGGQSTPMQELFANRDSLWFLAAFGILVAPALEEAVFRGFLFAAFERAHGGLAALLATSAIFALLHGGQYGWLWQQLAVLGAVGCAFGGIRLRSGSAKASALAHAAYNGLLFLLVAAWSSELG